MAYFAHCAEENVVHTEIMFDPCKRIPKEEFFRNGIKGIQKAEKMLKKYGISSLLIMSYLRHLSEEDAF